MSRKLTSDEVDQIVCDFYNEFNVKFIEQSKDPFITSSHLADISLANMFSSWFTEIVASLSRAEQDKILSNLKVSNALQTFL